ncbi:hypothetical protein MNBD_BACTEROID07-22, partial [hydrothermal vent metagenome]
MVEIGAAVARNDFGNEVDAAHGFLFEGVDFSGERLGDGVPVHVEVGGGEVFGECEAEVKPTSGFHLLDEGIGNGLSCFVVFGVAFQHGRFGSTASRTLSWHLLKIARNGSGRNAFVLTLAEKSVHGMTHFVK